MLFVIIFLACSGLAIFFNFLALPNDHPKRLLVILALCCSAVAFVGQLMTSRNNQKMQAELRSIGTPMTEWFPVTDDSQTEKFVISHRPIAGSVEVQVNGLPEEPDTYSVQGSEVYVTAMQQRSDRIAIKYRYTPTN